MLCAKLPIFIPTWVFCLVSLLPLGISDLSENVVLWAIVAAMRGAALRFGIWFANSSPIAQTQGQQNNFCVSWGLIDLCVTLSHFVTYTAWATESGKRINSEGNNTKRESGRNRSKFLRLKCKHNGGKRAINIRTETGYEGKKTQKNNTLNKIEAYFSPMGM